MSFRTSSKYAKILTNGGAMPCSVQLLICKKWARPSRNIITIIGLSSGVRKLLKWMLLPDNRQPQGCKVNHFNSTHAGYGQCDWSICPGATAHDLGFEVAGLLLCRSSALLRTTGHWAWSLASPHTQWPSITSYLVLHGMSKGNNRQQTWQKQPCLHFIPALLSCLPRPGVAWVGSGVEVTPRWYPCNWALKDLIWHLLQQTISKAETE